MRAYFLPQLEKVDYMGVTLTREDVKNSEACEEDTRFQGNIRNGDEQDDEEADIVETVKGFSKGEIMYMKEHGTLETPHNFPKAFLVTAKNIKKILFGAFELRTKFPHNIVLLKNRTIMYCTDFFECVTSKGTTEILITGFRFLKVHLIIAHCRQFMTCIWFPQMFILDLFVFIDFGRWIQIIKCILQI